MNFLPNCFLIQARIGQAAFPEPKLRIAQRFVLTRINRSEDLIKGIPFLHQMLLFDEKAVVAQPITQHFRLGHRLKDQAIGRIHAPFRAIQDPADRISAHTGNDDRVHRIGRTGVQSVRELEPDALRYPCLCGRTPGSRKRSFSEIRSENTSRISLTGQPHRQIPVICPDVDHAPAGTDHMKNAG